jgi:ribonuclease BN (tRNA processing enzyme)
MKYLYKAISTNTKDSRTGIMVIIEGSSYLFNAPDGLQRLTLTQGNSILKRSTMPRYIFLSSLGADHFSGFGAFYLSCKMAIE